MARGGVYGTSHYRQDDKRRRSSTLVVMSCLVALVTSLYLVFMLGTFRPLVPSRHVDDPAAAENAQQSSQISAWRHGGGSAIFRQGIIHLQGSAKIPDEADGPIANKTRQYPVLIHIPKTEGTNVELGFWYSNKLGVGENMFSKTSPSVSEKVKMRESKYAIVSQSTPACPNWHMPPSSFVHESFAIVGNPYVRMANEMCDAMALRDLPWFLRHMGYSQGKDSLKAISEAVFGKAQHVDMNRTDGDFKAKMCSVFKRWLVPALETSVEFTKRRTDPSVSFTGHECHLLPQKLFWQHAEWVVEMGSRNKIETLTRGYGFPGRLAPGCPPPARAPPPPTCRQAVLDCYDEEIAALVETIDAETFDYFQYSKDWRKLQTWQRLSNAADPASAASDLLSKGIIHRQGQTSMAEGDISIAGRKRKYPILIHAPKTGGTTVENALMSNYGIVVGMYAFQNKLPEATYPLLPPSCMGSCVDWHMPPSRFVEESFVVVRDPYKRVASEMCFAIMMKNNAAYRRFEGLKAVYKTIFGTDDIVDFKGVESMQRKKVCSLMSRWLRPMLYDVASFTHSTDSNASLVHTGLDCHLTPQYAFWRHAEWVIELESLSKSMTILMEGYGYKDFDLKKTEVHEGSETAKNTEMTSPPGCTQVVIDCLDDDLASLIEVLDHTTFDAFGYSKDWRRLQSAGQRGDSKTIWG